MPIPASQRKRAIIIGSGFGGLASAIRLQAAGFQTKILERLDKPGGRAYVYEDQGFTFDAGPTVVTAPDTIEELFEVGGRAMEDYVQLMEIDPMYRLYWEDGTTLDYCKDEERLLDQISQISPTDVDGYRRFHAYATEVYKEGYEKLCHVPFSNFTDMLRVSPQLVRLKAYRSVYSVVSSYLKDARLRQAFSFNSLLIGGNPFRASAIYTLIHPLERKSGVWFPRGGTHALVRALVKLYEDLGGEIFYNEAVECIETKAKRVTGVTSNGRRLTADFVVSNADVTYTYNQLLRHEPAISRRARHLRDAHHSMSLFVMYFGTNQEFKQISHHNVMFCSRYQELLEDIFDRGKLSDDFSLYLHAPSLSDPSLAPKGGQSFYVLSPVPHLGKLDVDWQTVGQQYGDRILEYLEERYMPGLRDAIVTRRHFTPTEFKNRLHAHHGSAFSLEPRLTQSAWFRVHNADPQIRGLYFAGAGTHPGAGIPGVIGSGKATANLIIQREYLNQGIQPQIHVRPDSDLQFAES